MGAALHGIARKDYLSSDCAECDEILLESVDVTGSHSDAFANGGSRSYPTLVPWDVPVRLVITSLLVLVFTLAVILVPEIYEYHQIPGMLLTTAVVTGLGIGVLSVLSQIPRRVTRKADSMVIEFLFHSHTVSLSDVLELVVLRDGRQFWQLLRRWKVFPSGQKLRLFFGAPSNAGSLCVLLTRRCFWSFVFCLEDPVKFLLDNQRPLDLEATYRATVKCLLREEEDLKSERIGSVPRGSRMKVLEQRGRRVLIKLEGSDSQGWISYMSEKGITLLNKQVLKGQATKVGTIGASELSRTGGGVLELGLVGNGTGLE
jgi:hypothetical protein